MMSGLVAIVMADLHFGAIPPQKFIHELSQCLFPRIIHMKRLDAFIIAGDLFDMKEYASSDTYRSVLLFLDMVLEYTEKLDTKIIILKGTRNHDDMQLTTLEISYKHCPRIKFIHTVTDDTINDVNLLYIPEEYILNQESYYSPWFSNHYDIMIGHGTIDRIWYARKNKRDDITSAPVFSVEDLCKVANYCYFGHEHEHRSYGKNRRFTYIGPTTRWEYDKPWDCGYYILHYDKQNELMREDFVVNEHAQILRTYSISVIDSMSMEQLMKKVESYLDADHYDGLKLVVHIKRSVPIYTEARNYLMTKIGLHDRVKLSIDLQEEEDVEETEQEKKERERTEELHQALFDNTPNDEVAIAEFILSKEGKTIPTSHIEDICGMPNH